MLKSAPVILAPSFDKELKLSIVASDDGYYSKIVKKHQRNCATIESECLSLILPHQHIQVYLTSSVAQMVIFTDHKPLTFIYKLNNKNQRLLQWSLMLQELNLDI